MFSFIDLMKTHYCVASCNFLILITKPYKIDSVCHCEDHVYWLLQPKYKKTPISSSMTTDKL